MADEKDKGISLHDLAMRAYNLGGPISPIQREYGPLDAFLISAGAASQSGLDQGGNAYHWLASNMADKWQGQGAGDPHRARIEEVNRQARENAELYAPLQSAYPYTTGAGEATPSFTAGLGIGATALRFNILRTYADDVLSSILASNPNTTLQRLAQSMKRF